MGILIIMCKRLDDFLGGNGHAARMTAHELAQKIQVDPVSVSRYRRGEKVPMHDVMTRLAIATGGHVMPNDFWQKDIPARIFTARDKIEAEELQSAR